MKKSAGKHKKFILAVTGVPASGKTTVARMFAVYNARLIDADRAGHDLLKKTSPVYRRVIAAFGAEISGDRGGISRAKLARVVFEDRKLLRRLNSLVHPYIIKEIKRKIRSSRSGFIVLDAPLLFEARVADLADAIVVVGTDRHRRLNRASRRASFDKQVFFKKTKAQLTQGEKSRRADFIIDNNGSLKETRKQVEQIYRQLICCLKFNQGGSCGKTRHQ